MIDPITENKDDDNLRPNYVFELEFIVIEQRRKTPLTTDAILLVQLKFIFLKSKKNKLFILIINSLAK